MRSLWKKFSEKQLDLPGVDSAAPGRPSSERNDKKRDTNASREQSTSEVCTAHPGPPLLVPITALEEDRANPRTEFAEAELDELADSIRQLGILQPIVVHPANAEGRHRLHFGAMRLRAAQRAGLQAVPVVVRKAPADPYAQFAENQKRHGLTPLDAARFIRARVDEGESNTTIARRTGMNLTSVAHHLAMLELPPDLDKALQSGRCTSPRTLHELSKLRDEQPEQVRALIDGDTEITRATVAAMRSRRAVAASCPAGALPAAKVLSQAHAACARLEHALEQLKRSEQELESTEFDLLKQRLGSLATWSLQGV